MKIPHRLKTRQRNEGPVMLRVSGPPVPKLRPVLPSAGGRSGLRIPNSARGRPMGDVNGASPAVMKAGGETPNESG